MISFVATIMEKYNTKKSHQSIYINSFSLRQNLKSLFANRSSEEFPCIHGIRVFTLLWVIFSHSAEWTNFQLFSRSFQVKQIFTRIESQLLLNGVYTVENFFFIGYLINKNYITLNTYIIEIYSVNRGMLTSFITLHYTKGKLFKFSTTAFLLSRFLRLTPQLFIFILITFLIPLLGSGPLWSETMTPVIENCSRYWWRNLFYIQNMFKANEMCALHSWYLACDMQYHWISILLVIPLLYKVKFGTLITCFVIISFYVFSAVFSYLHDLPPGLINTGRDNYFLAYYIDLFYIKPWSHGTVFFIGFLFGILAYNKKYMKLNKVGIH